MLNVAEFTSCARKVNSPIEIIDSSDESLTSETNCPARVRQNLRRSACGKITQRYICAVVSPIARTALSAPRLSNAVDAAADHFRDVWALLKIESVNTPATRRFSK